MGVGGRVEGLRLFLGGLAGSSAPVAVFAAVLEDWACVVGLMLFSSTDEVFSFLGGRGVVGRVDDGLCCLRLGGLMVVSAPVPGS